ncbi:MAG: hypothetical protein J6D44_06225 [Pseudomonas sp.]|nr:hypothetical protein [Pseudomonas sp.]
MSDLMREEFETWAMTNAFLGLSESCMERHKEGYLGCELHAAWEAWQASRECLVIDTRPIRIEADCHVDAGVESVFYAAIDAIHAAGVKTK